MEYFCISADGHLDLGWLPPELFVENSSAAVQDLMPYVTDGPDGRMWTNRRGMMFGLECGMGSGGRKYVPGLMTRPDRMAAVGLYSDAARTTRRLTDPEQRIKDQDLDGIQAEVLYGILGAVNRINDVAAGAEIARIYNDWLADFCKPHPDRLIGLALLPGNNAAAAVAEAKRVIRHGIRGVEMSGGVGAIPLFERQWDPLWAVLSQAGVPLHKHITPFILPPNPTHWTAKEARASHAVYYGKSPLVAVDSLMEMIFGGALERFPNLKLVFGETGLAWIPYVLERMDYEWEEQYKDLELKMKPSEYWKRQCKATFQYDAIGMRLIDLLGEDTLMWGSDFPHPDGVWPDSQSYIQKQFADLPKSTRRKIVCENAANLYKLV